MPAPEQAVGPIPADRDATEYDRQRRRVLWSMPTGLFVLGSRSQERRNLMTCNWAMQVATSPKLVVVSVEAGSVTRSLIDRAGSFSLSLLSQSQRTLVRRFVKPVTEVEVDGDGRAVVLQGVPVHEVADGLPCISAAKAWLACEVRHTLDGVGPGPATSSHVLYVGEVVDVGESVGSSGADDEESTDDDPILQMGDTRMNYGG